MRVHPVIVHAPVASMESLAAGSTARADQMSAQLGSVNLSDTGRDTSAFLVPLDTSSGSTLKLSPSNHGQQKSTGIADQHRRRDSLKHRDAVLKGNEGSRQRRRWENDRLLNNPWAQAPLPIDWEVHPTYPRRAVPYYLAPLWDAEAVERSMKNRMRGKRHEKGTKASPTTEAASSVPQELRSRLKHARAAKGLLHDLEATVRIFLEDWREKEKQAWDDGLQDADSEEEEIVFVGRNGRMLDSPSEHDAFKHLQRDKLVFDGLADDRGASFGRWLVHSIATYYGLRTWSVTLGDPARREAYVGLTDTRKGYSAPQRRSDLPCPLWTMI